MSTDKKYKRSVDSKGYAHGFFRGTTYMSFMGHALISDYHECVYDHGWVQGVFKGFYSDDNLLCNLYFVDSIEEGEGVIYDY